jgi:hypothetical protein
MPFELIVSFVLLCPLLIWDDIIYLPNEYYCYISFRNVRATILTGTANYGIPLFSLAFIYLRITRFIRQQPNTQAVTIKRRQERDFVVIQRIFIIVNILLTLGIPSMVIISILYATGFENPLLYRITWLSIDVSMGILSVIIVLMTPQLKNIVIKSWQRNRVMPMAATIGHSMKMRTIPSNE